MEYGDTERTQYKLLVQQQYSIDVDTYEFYLLDKSLLLHCRIALISNNYYEIGKNFKNWKWHVANTICEWDEKWNCVCCHGYVDYMVPLRELLTDLHKTILVYEKLNLLKNIILQHTESRIVSIFFYILSTAITKVNVLSVWTYYKQLGTEEMNRVLDVSIKSFCKRMKVNFSGMHTITLASKVNSKYMLKAKLLIEI